MLLAATAATWARRQQDEIDHSVGIPISSWFMVMAVLNNGGAWCLWYILVLTVVHTRYSRYDVPAKTASIV